MGKTNKNVKKFAKKGGVRAKVQKQHSKRGQQHKLDRRRNVEKKGAPAPKPDAAASAGGKRKASGGGGAAKQARASGAAKKDALDKVAVESMDVDDFLSTFNDNDDDDDGASSDDDDGSGDADNVWGDDDDSSDDEDMPTAMDSEQAAAATKKAKTKKKGKGRADQSEPPADKKGAKPQSEMQRHRAELEQLKDSDPEFYAFLQKNDPEMLAFGTGAEAEEDDDDDGADGSGGGGGDGDMAEVADADADARGSQGRKAARAVQSGGSKRPVLTAALLQRIILRTHRGSNRALILLVKAFRAGVKLGDTKQENAGAKFVIESSAVFNHLLVYCVGNMHRLLRRKLQGAQGQKQKGGAAAAAAGADKPFLPAQCKPWNALKSLVTAFLRNAVSLLGTVKDKEMKSFVLQRMRHYIVYFKILPKVGRRFLKALVVAWIGSTKLEKDEEDTAELAASESVRVHAFLRVRDLVLAAPRYYMTDALKGMYLAFVKRSKYTSELSLRKIQMARHCVVELFCIDPIEAYQFTFVYIRQLAIHLRQALKAPNLAAAVKNVYNWQFVHCLELWTEVLCVSSLREQKIVGPGGGGAAAAAAGGSTPGGETSMEPLLYPLVQVLLATANLLPAAQSFPLLLHCVGMLNKLSLVMRQYIPVFPVLLAMLQSAFLVPQTAAQLKAAEGGRGAAKPSKGVARAVSTLNLDVTLRLSASAMASRLVKDKVMTRVLALTEQFFAVHRFDLAQPELTFLPVRELRKFTKACRNPAWNRAVRALVQSTEAQASKIRSARAKLNFGPADTEKCAGFLREEREAHRQKLLVQVGMLSAKTGANPAGGSGSSSGGGGGDGQEEEEEEEDAAEAALKAHAASVVADNAGGKKGKKSKTTAMQKKKKQQQHTQAAAVGADGEDVVTPFAMWSDDDDDDDEEEEDEAGESDDSDDDDDDEA